MFFKIMFALLSPFLSGATNVVDSHLSNNLFKRVDTLVFFHSCALLVLLPILLLFGKPDPLTAGIFPFVFLFCVIEVVYQFPYFKAFRYADVSVNAALMFLSNLILPILAFLFLGEHLSGRQYIGFFIILLFNLILSINIRERFRINRAFYLMLFTSFILMIQLVVLKHITNVLSWYSTLFWTASLTVVLTFSLLLAPSTRRDIIRNIENAKKHWKILFANECLAQLINVIEFAAVGMLPIVIFSGITNTQPFFALAVGYILNKYARQQIILEKTDRFHLFKKIICFSFIWVGVLMMM